MDCIEYDVEVKGTIPFYKKIEFDYADKFIKRIEIESSNQPHFITLKYNLIGVFDEERAIEATKEITTDILNLFSNKFNIHFKQPYPSSVFINGKRTLYGRASLIGYSTVQYIGDYTDGTNKGIIR